MAIQIANPEVIKKVEALSKASGLNKTAAVEQAVEKMLLQVGKNAGRQASIKRIVMQFDQIPDRVDALNPVDYDERGLPR